MFGCLYLHKDIWFLLLLQRRNDGKKIAGAVNVMGPTSPPKSKKQSDVLVCNMSFSFCFFYTVENFFFLIKIFQVI